jgi:HSP20 family protein
MRENDMTGMTRWDLFEDLREAQDEMLRLSRMRTQRLSAADQHHHAGMSTPVWAPAVDISERKDAYLLAAELPGVGIEDLEITFEDGLLTIQGQRHGAPDSTEERIHRAERRYGAFRRSITLPTHVKPDAIEATTEDGVLRIMVPKADEVHAKRIQVRVGAGHTLPPAGDESETPS